MLDALRSEILKQSTLRSTAVYAVLLLGSLFGPIVLIGLTSGDSFSGEPQRWSDLYAGFFIFLAITVALCASRTTSDIKNRMTAQAFLTQEGRWQSLVAKAVVFTGFVTACFLAGTVLIWLSVAAFGGSIESGDVAAPIFARLALVVTLALVSIGFGALVRSNITAIALPLVWLLVGEQLIAMAAENISLFRPLRDVLLSTSMQHLDQGDAVAGAIAVLVGWIAVFGVAGLASNQLRDVR